MAAILAQPHAQHVAADQHHVRVDRIHRQPRDTAPHTRLTQGQPSRAHERISVGERW